MPVVIQFNKRDLPDIRPDEEIDGLAQQGKEPVFKAIATRGNGVLDTFVGLMKLTWHNLEESHGLASKFGIDAATVLQSRRQRIEQSGGGTAAGARS